MDILLKKSTMKLPHKDNDREPTDVYLHQHQHQQNVFHARTYIEHVSKFDIDDPPAFVREVNLGCTLGDLWNTDEDIRNMIKGGMNILRLNLSMGSHDYYMDVIKRVRAIDEANNFQPVVSIALDISAPPIRTGLINNDVDAEIRLEEGHFVTLTLDEEMRDQTCAKLVYIDQQYFPTFVQYVKVGDRIFMDDGMLSLIVREVHTKNIKCLVEQGGPLGSMKRVDIQNDRVYANTFETTYMQHLEFAKISKVDFVFTGYSLTREHILLAKAKLGDDILLFAKLQTKESIRNLDEILVCSDGIIVGRNGLNLAYPCEKIFLLQKHIIAKCNIVHKPVFVISQLLESMRFKPRATRAEVTDVANAVLDGADGLILTVETSRGMFPRGSLRVLHKTCRVAETAIYHEKFLYALKCARELRGLSILEPAYLAALAAVEASTASSSSAIFVITTTGRSANTIASFRPSCPVIAVMRRPEVARMCHTFRGIHPFVFLGEKLDDWSLDMDLRLNAAIKNACKRRFISDSDTIVIVTGSIAGSGATDTVRVFKLQGCDKPSSFVNSLSDLNWSD